MTTLFGSAAIDTTVTSDAADPLVGRPTDGWVRGVRASSPAGAGAGAGGALIVGLDCEWKPNYSSWTTSNVATLQLCNCLVLQMFYVNYVPASIRSLLGDPAVWCVGISVGEDAAKLADDYGLVCAAPVDLEDLCNAHLGIVGGGGRRTRLGLKGYAREVLGLAMEKPRHVTMSNWERRHLDVAQVKYACIDAYVSYKLGERLLDN